MPAPKLSAAGERVKACMLSMGVELLDSDYEAIAQAAKPPREQTELMSLTEAILDVCGWRTETMYGRVTRTAKKLEKAGIKAADIRLHYGDTDPGPDVWWWRRPGTDWRSILNDSIIAETCGKWDKKPVANHTVSRREQQRVSEREELRLFLAGGGGANGD